MLPPTLSITRMRRRTPLRTRKDSITGDWADLEEEAVVRVNLCMAL